MWYVILILAAIVFVVTLGKHILFNPRVNSVISILYFVNVIFTGAVPNIVRLLLVVSIIDCIRDIRIAEWRYDSINYCIDSTYLKKSLLSIFTLGLSRAVFFILDCPCVMFQVMRDINNKMQLGYPLEVSRYYYLKSSNHYYRRIIEVLSQKGKIISSLDTVDSEFDISKQKYIENHVEPTKETKKRLKEIKVSPRKHSGIYAEMAANDDIPKYKPAYLSAKLYQKYPQRIAEVMLTKGAVSPETIREFEELKDLNLTILLDGDSSWSVPFIIMALEELVAQGVVEDLKLSDEVEINHVYRHLRSTVKMKSINLNALLDDDDF